MHICIQAAPCTRTNALGIILATNTAQWTTDCFKEVRAQEANLRLKISGWNICTAQTAQGWWPICATTLSSMRVVSWAPIWPARKLQTHIYTNLHTQIQTKTHRHEHKNTQTQTHTHTNPALSSMLAPIGLQRGSSSYICFIPCCCARPLSINMWGRKRTLPMKHEHEDAHLCVWGCGPGESKCWEGKKNIPHNPPTSYPPQHPTPTPSPSCSLESKEGKLKRFIHPLLLSCPWRDQAKTIQGARGWTEDEQRAITLISLQQNGRSLKSQLFWIFWICWEDNLSRSHWIVWELDGSLP